MKKNPGFIYCAVLLSCALFLSGCESASSDDTAEGGFGVHTALAATSANIAGTWINTREGTGHSIDGAGVETYYTVISTYSRLLNADGTYIEIEKSERTTVAAPIVTTVYYTASKGTFSIADTGAVTWNRTHMSMSSTTPLTITDTIEWATTASTRTNFVVLLDGVLFIDAAFKRVGTGSGLVGTWIKESISEGEISGFRYKRMEDIFTSTSVTGNYYESTDGITYALDDSPYTVSYTQNGDSSISMFYNSESHKVYILLAGDLLVFGDDVTPLAGGWIKQ